MNAKTFGVHIQIGSDKLLNRFINDSLICMSLNWFDIIILNPYRNHEIYLIGSKKTGVDLKIEILNVNITIVSDKSVHSLSCAMNDQQT